MVRALAKIVLVIAVAGALSGRAAAMMVDSIPAGPLSPPLRTSTVPAPATPMAADFGAAGEPFGYVSFCLRFADQCRFRPGEASTIAMTPALWQMLGEVDDGVNNSIRPEDDRRHYDRAEYWTIPTDGYGDCEDYALTKRKDLIALGLSESALRIAIVVTPRGNRHAVLTVVTDQGDYVLDNLVGAVLPWNASGYVWIERQSPANGGSWVSLRPAGPRMAAAAKI
ncbi:MAG: transglutaminase-like cysteine peptidase [Rhizomicrobium sp.]